MSSFARSCRSFIRMTSFRARLRLVWAILCKVSSSHLRNRSEASSSVSDPCCFGPAEPMSCSARKSGGAGPTGLVLKQTGGWTYGLLFNHIWSYAGESSRAYVSSTFLQPFISYTTISKTTFGLNTESTYDWNAGQWTVPINVSVSQLRHIMKLTMQCTFVKVCAQ